MFAHMHTAVQSKNAFLTVCHSAGEEMSESLCWRPIQDYYMHSLVMLYSLRRHCCPLLERLISHKKKPCFSLPFVTWSPSLYPLPRLTQREFFPGALQMP